MHICTLLIETKKLRTEGLSDQLKIQGFLVSSVGEEFACNVGDPGLIPGSGRSPGAGHGNPLQYYCLETSMDREPWQGLQRVGHD